MSDEVLELLTELFVVIDAYGNFEWDPKIFNVFCKIETLLKSEISRQEQEENNPYSEDF